MSAALAVIVTLAAGATSAGATALELSSLTNGFNTRSQKVQFQPLCASAGRIGCVRWPPKNANPRAPATIA